MIKVSRKTSADPVQEKLRQHKATWNKEVSAFIDNLIHFKKMMNGWPSKFLMERSSIGEALPKDPTSILGVLAGDFRELAADGNQIIEEQIAYSKGRRRKSPKQSGYHELPPAGSTPPAAPSGLAAALSSAEYDLIAEGSGRISRTLSRLKGPILFGPQQEKNKRRFRLILLSNAAKMDRNLSRMQQSIVGQTEYSIIRSIGFLDDVMLMIYTIFQTLQSYMSFENLLDQPTKDKEPPTKSEKTESVSTKSEKTESVPAESKQSQQDSPVVKEAIGKYKDYESNSNIINKFDEFAAEIRNVNKLYGRLFQNLSITNYYSIESINKHAQNLISACDDLLSKLNNKLGQQAKSFKDLIFEQKNASQQQINIIAQNIVSKWVGKGINHLSPFDSTSSIRLALYKAVTSIRKDLNKIMDKLEKDLEPQSIYDDFKNLEAELYELRPLTYSLQHYMSPEGAKKVKELEKKQKEEKERSLRQRLLEREMRLRTQKLQETFSDKSKPKSEPETVSPVLLSGS
jgi:hypothetical protein